MFSKLPRSLLVYFPILSGAVRSTTVLLSSADLISVVDDPFLPDPGPWGGAGGLQQGRLCEVCVQRLAVEKPVLAT